MLVLELTFQSLRNLCVAKAAYSGPPSEAKMELIPKVVKCSLSSLMREVAPSLPAG